jgi:ABC-type multidrug transport system permease subunit
VRNHPVVQLTLAKIRLMWREPEAIFWIFVFPVLLTVALGIAFRSSGPAPMAVGVEAGPGAAEAVAAISADPLLKPAALPPGEATRALAAGKLAIVVVPGNPPAYRFDPTREDSRLARLAVDAAMQHGAGRGDAFKARDEHLTEKGSRYIDFLVPGLLGMNLMGTGMWGIGFGIVVARSKGLLKRYVASPMRRSHYLLAQMAGRLIFLVLEVVVILGFGHWVFDVPIRGSLLLIATLCLAGSLAFAGLGLLVASRAQTIEGVSGLMNFVMLPMWLASGVFFSPSRFPDLVQPLVQALPLTALNDALRAVMLEGAGFPAVAGELGILAAWGIVAFLAAVRLFRWQ